MVPSAAQQGFRKLKIAASGGLESRIYLEDPISKIGAVIKALALVVAAPLSAATVERCSVQVLLPSMQAAFMQVAYLFEYHGSFKN